MQETDGLSIGILVLKGCLSVGFFVVGLNLWLCLLLVFGGVVPDKSV
jgi:hypothetical protein